MILVNTLVPIAFFTLVFLIVYVTSKFDLQVKKAILEKGGHIEYAKRRFPFLELGCTVLGLGLGLGLSVMPQSSDLPEEARGLLTAACILACSGAGLITAFFIRRRIDKK